MNQEPWFLPKHVGSIEVICGGMFSGKTEELLRRARRALIAGQKLILIKPAQDNRYSEDSIVSHDKNRMESYSVRSAQEIPSLADGKEVICIDEAQFFDLDLIDIINELANQGKRIIVAGLDMDYEGKPFEPIPQLLAIAEYITKLHAICSKSGLMANFSQRVTSSKERIVIGEAEVYEPRARHCFNPKHTTE